MLQSGMTRARPGQGQAGPRRRPSGGQAMAMVVGGHGQWPVASRRFSVNIHRAYGCVYFTAPTLMIARGE